MRQVQISKNQMNSTMNGYNMMGQQYDNPMIGKSTMPVAPTQINPMMVIENQQYGGNGDNPMMTQQNMVTQTVNYMMNQNINNGGINMMNGVQQQARTMNLTVPTMSPTISVIQNQPNMMSGMYNQSSMMIPINPVQMYQQNHMGKPMAPITPIPMPEQVPTMSMMGMLPNMGMNQTVNPMMTQTNMYGYNNNYGMPMPNQTNPMMGQQNMMMNGYNGMNMYGQVNPMANQMNMYQNQMMGQQFGMNGYNGMMNQTQQMNPMMNNSMMMNQTPLYNNGMNMMNSMYQNSMMNQANMNMCQNQMMNTSINPMMGQQFEMMPQNHTVNQTPLYNGGINATPVSKQELIKKVEKDLLLKKECKDFIFIVTQTNEIYIFFKRRNKEWIKKFSGILWNGCHIKIICEGDVVYIPLAVNSYEEFISDNELLIFLEKLRPNFFLKKLVRSDFIKINDEIFCINSDNLLEKYEKYEPSYFFVSPEKNKLFQDFCNALNNDDYLFIDEKTQNKCPLDSLPRLKALEDHFEEIKDYEG
jgi:hypothetical protein